MNQRMLVLGGYGNTGRLIAELLLKQTDVKIAIAGRNQSRATEFVQNLNSRFPGDRVSALSVDATDAAALRLACANVDFVVNAASTAEFTREIVQTILAVKVDYLDTQYSTQKVNILESMRPQIEESDSCIITDGGFHPGLPAAMVRYAASKFETLRSANVSSYIRQNWKAVDVSESTRTEMAEEFRDYRYDVYKNGEWEASWKNMRRFDFGDPLGTKNCAPMFLQELTSLPEEFPSLQETGFYVTGFHWFVDYVVMMLGWLGMKIWPDRLKRPVGQLLLWSLQLTSSPPFLTILQLEAEGKNNETPHKFLMRISHRDGYYLTAVPVVACLMQYLDGTIGAPGLWYQANVVEPQRFMNDLRDMRIDMSEEWS
ncbi:MAG: hypothetical protein MAGBODY4_01355 [Candidatus Marinimicrobia bacterium]|nr:hypothetical protein [Candidatus Neomarinimicrobiota bacterium]